MKHSIEFNSMQVRF